MSSNWVLAIGRLLDPKTGIPVEGPVGNPEYDLATRWVFLLREESDDRMRLIIRLRRGWPNGAKRWLVNRLFWEPVHFVMEWKILHTMKRLPEESHHRIRLSGKDPIASVCQ